MIAHPATRAAADRTRRFITLTAALLLAMLIAATTALTAQAQDGGGLALVNHDRELVERKKGGGFVARPVFDRQPAAVHYGIRHPETGDWITPMFRVHSAGSRRADGWEYAWHYPAIPQQPDLDREEPFLLVIVAMDGGDAHTFNVVIPVYQPTSIWDRVLAALDPGRWARAFAGWMVEAVHGALCGIVEQVTGADACGGG